MKTSVRIVAGAN